MDGLTELNQRFLVAYKLTTYRDYNNILFTNTPDLHKFVIEKFFKYYSQFFGYFYEFTKDDIQFLQSDECLNLKSDCNFDSLALLPEYSKIVLSKYKHKYTHNNNNNTYKNKYKNKNKNFIDCQLEISLTTTPNDKFYDMSNLFMIEDSEFFKPNGDKRARYFVKHEILCEDMNSVILLNMVVYKHIKDYVNKKQQEAEEYLQFLFQHKLPHQIIPLIYKYLYFKII